MFSLQLGSTSNLIDYTSAPSGSYHGSSNIWRQYCTPAMHGVGYSRITPSSTFTYHSFRLLRRIEGKTRSQREPLNELQADIPALEVLNDVGKLLREVWELIHLFTQELTITRLRPNHWAMVSRKLLKHLQCMIFHGILVIDPQISRSSGLFIQCRPFCGG